MSRDSPETRVAVEWTKEATRRRESVARATKVRRGIFLGVAGLRGRGAEESGVRKGTGKIGMLESLAVDWGNLGVAAGKLGVNMEVTLIEVCGC